MKQGMRKALALMMALVMLAGAGALAETAGEASGNVNCYVEIADNQGDPGDPTQDPEDAGNYELYQTAEGSPEEYLRSPTLGRRFARLKSQQTNADGTVDAYYERQTFTYEFDVFNEMGEMTIGGETYRGGGAERYTVRGKYEQAIVFPGLENGLMPVNTNANMPDAYCAGWMLDERTGSKQLLTYTKVVAESMLPTDDMPYDDLVFTLTGTWFGGQDKCILACWYEQLPEEAGVEGANRMTYNGATYINYPATNYEFSLPKGSKPSASDAPGLKFITMMEPDSSQPYPEGDTWDFLYQRQTFKLTIDGGEGGSVQGGEVPYQRNLGSFDPGWGEGTTVEKSGATYAFAGWYQDGSFLSYSLSKLWMTPGNLKLEARWEKQ